MTRMERYQALLKRWYVLEDEHYSGYEDAQEYLTGEKDLHQFAVVCSGGEDYYYVYPAFDTWVEASKRAVDYVLDSIYSETPVEIVDLDSGKTWVPEWSALPWQEVIQ